MIYLTHICSNSPNTCKPLVAAPHRIPSSALTRSFDPTGSRSSAPTAARPGARHLRPRHAQSTSTREAGGVPKLSQELVSKPFLTNSDWGSTRCMAAGAGGAGAAERDGPSDQCSYSNNTASETLVFSTRDVLLPLGR